MKIGTYKIIYPSGITQILNLISHSDYTDIIKPTKSEISELKEIKRPSIEQIERLKELNAIIDFYGNDFFTDGSPLGYAMSDGILRMSENQGGNKQVKFEKIL